MGQSQARCVLLVGKTGTGKSSTANSIIGERVFQTASNTTSVTQDIQLAETTINDALITVVDGPGLSDTDLSREKQAEQIIESTKAAFQKCLGGFHAILYVIRYGSRFTQEDRDCFETLKIIFGDDAFEKHGIVLMTCGDHYDPNETGMPFSEWWAVQRSFFQELVTACKRRIILFDNRTRDETVKKRQREELIAMILQLRSSPYTKTMYDNREVSHKRFLANTCKSAVERRVTTETALFRARSETLLRDPPTLRLFRLVILLAQIDNLLNIVKEKDRGTEILQDIKENVENTKTIVLFQHRTFLDTNDDYCHIL